MKPTECHQGTAGVHHATDLGICLLAGVLACVALVFLLLLPPDAQGPRTTTTILSEPFAMPGALQWKGVAEIIAKGFHGLPAAGDARQQEREVGDAGQVALRGRRGPGAHRA